MDATRRPSIAMVMTRLLFFLTPRSYMCLFYLYIALFSGIIGQAYVFTEIDAPCNLQRAVV